MSPHLPPLSYFSLFLSRTLLRWKATSNRRLRVASLAARFLGFYHSVFTCAMAEMPRGVSGQRGHEIFDVQCSHCAPARHAHSRAAMPVLRECHSKHGSFYVCQKELPVSSYKNTQWRILYPHTKFSALNSDVVSQCKYLTFVDIFRRSSPFLCTTILQRNTKQIWCPVPFFWQERTLDELLVFPLFPSEKITRS